MTSWNDYSGKGKRPKYGLIALVIGCLVLVVGSIVVLVGRSEGPKNDEQVEALGSIFSSTTTPERKQQEELNRSLVGEGSTDEVTNAALTLPELQRIYTVGESSLTPQVYEQVKAASTDLITAYTRGVGRERYPGYFPTEEPVWAPDAVIDHAHASAVPGFPDLVRGYVFWHGTSYLGVEIQQARQSVYFSRGANGSLSAVPPPRIPEVILRNDVAIDGDWIRAGTTRPSR